MTILHLRASNFYGGPERQLFHHAQVMGGSRHRVVIASYKEHGRNPELLDVAEMAGIDNLLIDVSSAYDFTAVGKIRKALLKERVDLLCTHDYRSHLLGHAVCRKSKAKHICFVRGATKDDLKVRLYQWLDKMTLPWANHAVTVSDQQRRTMTDSGYPQARISVVHNAVSLSDLSEIEPVDLRTVFELPPDAVVVMAAGRFSREKGQRLLVETAARIIEQDRRLHFVLYGDGPDLGPVKRQVAGCSYPTQIRLPGFSAMVISYLKSADILVNPSYSEGLPNVVLEAMAVGTPVVATAVGGVPELIVNRQSGLLVPAGDSNGLGEAILLLAEDLPIRKRLAENGQQVVRQRFTFEQQAKKLTEVYEEVAA
ncbi:MAG: glycosyltransferase family 4 protein [candidate division Zixibacteria bacterium]|nr:glycosyltransferase family 4 protein [candidate division Zixibacteria bacterium]MDH3936031.1 glycosyltransferase family 4 protein [candidate division Zixibacteria bacterium]MDH4033819.1 glycosyltransferase family 4 protein [candidate division Zixibacteria bacterium]